VNRQLPVNLSTWRRHPLRADTWSEFGEFYRQIAHARYDYVIDAQGLIRSALLARLARGLHCGYDRQSVRERPASLFYDRKFPVSVTIHAAERMRQLAAQAMGYPLPDVFDYGLDIAADRPSWVTPERYLVFLHATARPEKNWGLERWTALARRAADQDLAVVAPWGSERERQRSTQLAAAAPGGITPPKLGYRDLAALLAGAAAVVGVDTGLTHLASAVGAPTVAIYTATWSELNGVIGPAFVANLGGPGAPPSVDEVWGETQKAIAAGRRQGAWRRDSAAPAANLEGRRRFRPAKTRVRVRVRREGPAPNGED
jgi:heptosyltransferase-1